MADKKFPHETLLADAEGVFSTKDLPAGIVTAIKVFNMHKGRTDANENSIKSLQIAEDIEKWMTKNDYVIVEESEPAPAAEEVAAAEKAAAEAAAAEKAKADAAAGAAAAEKAKADATDAEKAKADAAAAEAAAAEKAKADAAAAEKAIADKAAADKLAEEQAAADKAAYEAAQKAAAEEEAKKDPHYGMVFKPLLGWVKKM